METEEPDSSALIYYWGEFLNKKETVRRIKRACANAIREPERLASRKTISETEIDKILGQSARNSKGELRTEREIIAVWKTEAKSILDETLRLYLDVLVQLGTQNKRDWLCWYKPVVGDRWQSIPECPSYNAIHRKIRAFVDLSKTELTDRIQFRNDLPAANISRDDVLHDFTWLHPRLDEGWFQPFRNALDLAIEIQDLIILARASKTRADEAEKLRVAEEQRIEANATRRLQAVYVGIAVTTMLAIIGFFV